MRYFVEVVSGDSDAKVVHRIKINALNRKSALAKAQMLLAAWRKDGDQCARVLNSRNEYLYSLQWTSAGNVTNNEKIEQA